MPRPRRCHKEGGNCYCKACIKEYRAARPRAKPTKAPPRLTDEQAARLLCKWLEAHGVNCTLAILNGRNLVRAEADDGAHVYRSRLRPRVPTNSHIARRASRGLPAPHQIAQRWLSSKRADIR